MKYSLSLISHDHNLSPERLFLSSIKSEATKTAYRIYLKKYLQFYKLDNLCDLLGKEPDAKQIEGKIINFIIEMKEKGKNHCAIRNYVAPLMTFYKINDVMINSKKIAKFMPPITRVKTNRGYSHEEIEKLLSIADERMKVVILLLVSGGMRIGSLPNLRLRNLKKCGDIYKVTIYEGEAEEYFTFVTREASETLDSYLDMRIRYGEKLTPDSLLIREQFDIRDKFASVYPKKVRSQMLSVKIGQLAERAGIRQKTHLREGERSAEMRKTVPRAHGLRKTFTTLTVNSRMDAIKRKMLEGHAIGIDSHYYKPSEADLLEEYQTKALENLTIDPANRLRKKVEKLQEDQDEITLMKLEHDKEMKAMRQDMDKIISYIRENPKLAKVKTEVLSEI